MFGKWVPIRQTRLPHQSELWTLLCVHLLLFEEIKVFFSESRVKRLETTEAILFYFHPMMGYNKVFLVFLLSIYTLSRKYDSVLLKYFSKSLKPVFFSSHFENVNTRIDNFIWDYWFSRWQSQIILTWILSLMSGK